MNRHFIQLNTRANETQQFDPCRPDVSSSEEVKYN